MKINFQTKFLLFLFLFVSFSCEDPVEDTGQPEETNIWNHNLDQDTGQLSMNLKDLFFNFNEQLAYTYNYYSVNGFEGTENSIEEPCFLEETDTLVFSTFPNYLLEAENCNGSDCDDLGITATDDYMIHSILDETYGVVSEDENGDNTIYNCSIFIYSHSRSA